jgi:DMSO reductase family type II enzyme heme b subunit
MQCRKVSAARGRLLDPAALEWTQVPAEVIALDVTPLANQPSEYVKASRSAQEVGKVRSLMVQAAHDGSDVFFRLSWEDATPNREIVDTNVFPDACGILMPLGGGDPPIDEMGSAAAPVNAWYWRASAPEEARNVVAGGLGTTRATAQSPVRARSLWEDGAWAVVFTRPLTVSGQAQEATPLAAGGAVKVGFAVWEGSNGERAGLKSFSREWRELTLGA